MGYVYIAAALLSWTALAFVYRVVETRRGNRYSMSAAMGLATVLWTLAFAGFRGIDLWQAAGGQVGIGACQGAMQAILIPLFMANFKVDRTGPHNKAPSIRFCRPCSVRRFRTHRC